MALADLIKAIEADTKQRAARLENLFAARAEEIGKKYAARQAEMVAASAAQGEQECAKLRRKGEAFWHMERKNALLSSRKKALDQLYQEAQTELIASKEYQQLLVGWLKQAEQELPGGVVMPARGQSKQLAQALATSRAKYDLGEESAAFAGGFKIVGEEADLDYSLENLVGRSLRERTEMPAAKLLFG